MTQGQDQRQTLRDVMDPARARALQATLGLPQTIGMGDALPPFFHHIYFWDPHPPEALGRDGHPALGALIPDFGLPKRMWAAGRVQFHTQLRAGIQAEKTTTLESVTQKTGRSGPLAFVRLRHDIRQRAGIVISEWQDIVYRQDHPTEQPTTPPKAPDDETHRETHDLDSTSLFRYSALTFNGHRIHYDAPYANATEGYDNLVIHGPLLAQLLILMGERMLGTTLREVSYRATSPLTLPHPAILCWKDGAAWVRGPSGEQCMTATIR